MFFKPRSSSAAGAEAATAPEVEKQLINIRFFTDYPVCNYKCPYCVAGHAPPEGRGPSPWDEDRYLQIIDNICKLDFPINIRIGVGGEFFISKVLVEGARRLGAADNVRVRLNRTGLPQFCQLGPVSGA